jgi:hypothetical protein
LGRKRAQLLADRRVARRNEMIMERLKFMIAERLVCKYNTVVATKIQNHEVYSWKLKSVLNNIDLKKEST